LGVAHDREGSWKVATEAQHKFCEYHDGGDAFDFIFLATAH
jgi:hypothetical protein